jgi:hypothetical protein
VVCKADAPYIEDADDIKDAAYAAAMTRWVEANRVLTLEEVARWYDANDGTSFCYEHYNNDSSNGWIDAADYGAMPGRYYGQSWRLWIRRPTDEERAAVAWEQEGQP